VASTRTVTCAALGALALLLPSAAAAQQQPPRPYVEYRADAIFARGTAAQLGAGVVLPLGVYVRLGVDAAAGGTWRYGQTVASGRVDAIARFLLDPFRESRLGLSLGGGVSAPIGSEEPSQPPYLTTVLDVEWRRHRGTTPALEIGLGGGTRIGIVLRRSPMEWR
jgi:hypothetical protein